MDSFQKLVSQLVASGQEALIHSRTIGTAGLMPPPSVFPEQMQLAAKLMCDAAFMRGAVTALTLVHKAIANGSVDTTPNPTDHPSLTVVKALGMACDGLVADMKAEVGDHLAALRTEERS